MMAVATVRFDGAELLQLYKNGHSPPYVTIPADTGAIISPLCVALSNIGHGLIVQYWPLWAYNALKQAGVGSGAKQTIERQARADIAFRHAIQSSSIRI